MTWWLFICSFWMGWNPHQRAWNVASQSATDTADGMNWNPGELILFETKFDQGKNQRGSFRKCIPSFFSLSDCLRCSFSGQLVRRFFVPEVTCQLLARCLCSLSGSSQWGWRVISRSLPILPGPFPTPWPLIFADWDCLSLKKTWTHQSPLIS